MSHEENNKLDKIYEAVEKINRGLYGDADNKVPGLMQSHYELRDDVNKLKDDKKKQRWIIAGISVTVPVIVHLAKELWRNSK